MVISAASCDALLEQAAAHYRAGQLREAEALYRQVLAVQPDRADLHAGLGTLLFLQARTDEAFAALRQALRIAPGNTETLYKLGNMLLREGSGAARISESFDCFRRHAALTFNTGAKDA